MSKAPPKASKSWSAKRLPLLPPAAEASSSGGSHPGEQCWGARHPRMIESGGSASATRRLLRRLRDIMAGSGTAQERLDRIVRVAAAEMVAEVCSAYIMRA